MAILSLGYWYYLLSGVGLQYDKAFNDYSNIQNNQTLYQSRPNFKTIEYHSIEILTPMVLSG